MCSDSHSTVTHFTVFLLPYSQFFQSIYVHSPLCPEALLWQWVTLPRTSTSVLNRSTNELVFLFPFFAMQGPGSQLGMNSNVTSDKHLFLVRNMMCLQAVEWATEKQRACAKSCNILMLLSASEYLGLRKGHVVWSLGHFKHKGKKCISEKDSQGLGLEERPH